MSWLALAGTAVSVGGSVLASSLNQPSGGGSSMPQYRGEFQPIQNVPYSPTQGAEDLQAMYPTLANIASQQTAYGQKWREKLMPGAAAQLANASTALNSYLRGEIPQDVVNQTNRTVAQRTGGTFNPFTGGGNSQQAFARSIGQTSLSLQQAGLSAAPVWQQLTQSFITQPLQVAPYAFQAADNRYKYDALNTGINQYNQEGQLGIAAQQYQGGVNDFNAGLTQQGLQQAGFNNAVNTGLGIAQAGASIYGGMQAGQGTQVQRPAGYITSNGQLANDAGILGNYLRANTNSNFQPANQYGNDFKLVYGGYGKS